MADGYAQATRNAGFVNLHSAAGVGNALGNIYTARQPDPAGDHGGPAGPQHPAAAALSLRRARRGISAALCKVQRRAGPRRGCPGGHRPRLLHGDAAALRADLCLGADRRLEPPNRAGAGPPRQPRTRTRRGWMQAFAAAIAASKRPAFVVGPAIDRAQAVELMVRVAEQAEAAVWVSPFSPRSSFPDGIPSSRVSCMPRRRSSPTRCATTIWWQ